MKSGKQRRAELAAEREAKRTENAAKQRMDKTPEPAAPVNFDLLAPNNSWTGSNFMRLGYYIDEPFRCVDCGVDEVWRARQQKWWYEVAKGHIFSEARRCRNCRRKRRERSNESRRVHLEGLERRRQKMEATRAVTDASEQ